MTAIGLAHNHTMKRTTVNAKGLTGIQVNLGDGADNLAIIRPTKAWMRLREIVTGGRGTKVLIIPADASVKITGNDPHYINGKLVNPPPANPPSADPPSNNPPSDEPPGTEPPTNDPPTTDPPPNPDPPIDTVQFIASFIAELDSEREALGLPILAVDNTLTTSAQMETRNIQSQANFSTTTPAMTWVTALIRSFRTKLNSASV